MLKTFELSGLLKFKSYMENFTIYLQEDLKKHFLGIPDLILSLLRSAGISDLSKILAAQTVDVKENTTGCCIRIFKKQ